MQHDGLNRRGLDLQHGLVRTIAGVYAGQPCTVHYVTFDPDGFAAGALAHKNLVWPASVARSVPRRQADFHYGRQAASAALSAIGLKGACPTIGSVGQPVWPAGIIGSITHSQGLAAAVALRKLGHTGVGIDVETSVAADTREALLETVVDESELSLVTTVTTEAKADLLLTAVFSAKESLFKAAYPQVGRFFDFCAARLTHVDPVGQVLTLTLTHDLCESLPAGRSFSIPFWVFEGRRVFSLCLY